MHTVRIFKVHLPATVATIKGAHSRLEPKKGGKEHRMNLPKDKPKLYDTFPRA